MARVGEEILKRMAAYVGLLDLTVDYIKRGVQVMEQVLGKVWRDAAEWDKAETELALLFEACPVRCPRGFRREEGAAGFAAKSKNRPRQNRLGERKHFGDSG